MDHFNIYNSKLSENTDGGESSRDEGTELVNAKKKSRRQVRYRKHKKDHTKSYDAEEPKEIPRIPRDSFRAESMIRETISKMENNPRNTIVPGMITATSLANLICSEYNWPVSQVHSKIEKALKSAISAGNAKEYIHKKNGTRSYSISKVKIKKYIERFRRLPESDNKKLYYKYFSDLMDNEGDDDV